MSDNETQVIHSLTVATTTQMLALQSNSVREKYTHARLPQVMVEILRPGAHHYLKLKAVMDHADGRPCLAFVRSEVLLDIVAGAIVAGPAGHRAVVDFFDVRLKDYASMPDGLEAYGALGDGVPSLGAPLEQSAISIKWDDMQPDEWTPDFTTPI